MPPKRKRLGRPPGSKNRKNANAKRAEKHKAHKVRVPNIKKEKGIYACGVCSNEFPTDEMLTEHIQNCNKPTIETIIKKAKYICEECPKKFRFQKSYEDHCQNEHSKLPDSVACNLCSVRCPNTLILEEHVGKVHERDIYLCPNCNKEFVRRSHVLRHMAQSGCDGQGGSTYSCEICDATFSRKDNLMVHIRMQHILKNDFKCKMCAYTTKNHSKLVNHWHKNHAENPDQYQCDHCHKWTSSRAAMAKHLEIHGEKKYACHVCRYSTYTIEVMRRHVLTHAAEKPFKCGVCAKSFIQRAQLQRCLLKHTSNPCAQCGQHMPSRSRLLTHMRGHMDPGKQTCPVKICPYASKEFFDEASLTAHLKLHLDDKPYKCEVCGKAFESEVNLRRHLETHTMDRPRRCMYCLSARAYVRGEHLARHVRNKHPAVFRTHLAHVRAVLGLNDMQERVSKSEIESIINLLDAESERILQGCGGGVLYGGIVDPAPTPAPDVPLASDNTAATEQIEIEDVPLMSEEELSEDLTKLLSHLIDKETLSVFGWPGENVDVVLEKVIEQCGAEPAAGHRPRVQRLRDNARHLFLHVLEDKTVARMLAAHSIDHTVRHILRQVADDDA